MFQLPEDVPRLVAKRRLPLIAKHFEGHPLLNGALRVALDIEEGRLESESSMTKNLTFQTTSRSPRPAGVPLRIRGRRPQHRSLRGRGRTVSILLRIRLHAQGPPALRRRGLQGGHETHEATRSKKSPESLPLWTF